MMHRVAPWIRVVLPNSDVAWLAIFGHLLVESIYLFTLWRFLPDERVFRNLRLGYLGFVAGAYGISRVALFHPMLNDQYRKWLQSVPWTPAKTLPAGPITLLPQDLVVVGVLTGLTREASGLAAGVPLCFLITYLGMLAATARICGDWIMGYLLAAGLVAIGLSDTPSAGFLTAAAFCPVGLISVQRSLNRFPWDFDWNTLKKLNNTPETTESHGWPHDCLAPVPPRPWLPYPDGFCLSFLIAWAAFVIMWNGGFFLVMVSSIGAVWLAALSRLYWYVRFHRPPITVFGRLWTGRWIIPGYDVIFVAPLLAGGITMASQIAAAILHGPGFWIGWDRWPAYALSIAGLLAGLLLLTIGGPGLERWRLTGEHRITFDASSKQANCPFVEL